MAKNPRNPALNLQWDVQLQRVTVFLAKPLSQDEVRNYNLWQNIFTDSPDIDEFRPKEFARRQLGTVEVLTDSEVEIRITTNRVDINLQSTSSPMQGALGRLEGLTDKFLDSIMDGLVTIKSPARLALGGICRRAVPDKEASYEELAKLLPAVQIDPKNSSDFTYSINRPITQKIAGREIGINRIGRWASVRMDEQIIGQSETPMISTQHYVWVEVDINTVPSNENHFSKSQVRKIYGEFSTLFAEIVFGGDVVK